MADGLSIHDALGFWQATCIDLVRDDNVDLSLRRMSILLTIYLERRPTRCSGSRQNRVSPGRLSRAP